MRSRLKLVPPPTSVIARHFAPLDAEQTAQVLDFCRTVLPKKYEEMELAEDSYFQTACVWQLSVYDHAGEARSFRYRIHGENHSGCGSNEHLRCRCP